MKLARNIGKQFTAMTLSVSSIDKDGSTSKNASEDNVSITSHDTTDTNITDLPNSNEYPLFNCHGLNINDETIRNKAVHELLKNMGGKAIFIVR
jgi:hypothetical protein